MKEYAWINFGDFMLSPLLPVAVFILLCATPAAWAAPPQVAAVGGATYVIKEDGSLWAWGVLTFREPQILRRGEEGDESLDTQVKTSAVPVQVTGDSDWAYISTTATYPHTAIKADGSLWAWGSMMPSGRGPSIYPKEKWKHSSFHTDEINSPLQISTEPNWWVKAKVINPQDKTPLSKPTKAGLGWATAAGGIGFVVLLQSDGTLWRWGTFNEGFKGPGSGVHYTHPTQVGNGNDWKAVAAIEHHAVAIKKDGSLWGWGIDTWLLGLDDLGGWVPEPVQVGEEKDWEAVAAGGNFFLALKADGSLWAWGANQQGVRGISHDAPIPTTRYLPNRIGSDTDWAAIGAGKSHALAIKKDGSLWAWGSNEQGQLGHGEADQMPHLAPAQVGTDTDWVAIDGGGEHTVALKTNGSVWTWGNNSAGQLGDGTKEDRYLPVKVFSIK